jgi:hypothetical protein
MNWIGGLAGRWLARYLNRPIQRYEPFAVSDQRVLKAVLRPADILLVEGNTRVSTAIKYLTQSTWSHAAMFVGDIRKNANPAEPLSLIEADVELGVVAVPLGKYATFNTRICRPVGLTPGDQQRVVEFMEARVGLAYDLKNIIDLARYLFPTPPVPVSWRRRMLAFGSGDPTRAICSTLIAQAFQSVRYPILPRVERQRVLSPGTLHYTEKEILHIRHHSLFAPRDFDLSPYFRVVKPVLEAGFDYRNLAWHDKIESLERDSPTPG